MFSWNLSVSCRERKISKLDHGCGKRSKHTNPHPWGASLALRVRRSGLGNLLLEWWQGERTFPLIGCKYDHGYATHHWVKYFTPYFPSVLLSLLYPALHGTLTELGTAVKFLRVRSKVPQTAQEPLTDPLLLGEFKKRHSLTSGSYSSTFPYPVTILMMIQQTAPQFLINKNSNLMKNVFPAACEKPVLGSTVA